MKDYKIILISFVLLIFLIGAVSAVDGEDAIVDDNLGVSTDDSIVVGDGNNNLKEIYVSTVGDDSNQGTKESPYFSINKAVGDVNSSQEAIIYLDEGTFGKDSDVAFNFNFNHVTDGGNLTIVGAGVDKTFIDGQLKYKFGTLKMNTIVTVKNITFINFKAGSGSVLYAQQGGCALTVDNCAFKNCYSINRNSGVIRTQNNQQVKVTVTNSLFDSIGEIGNSMSSSFICNGGVISSTNNELLYLENNTFTNVTIKNYNGLAIYSSQTKTKIINNKFINLTGALNDASIFVTSSGSEPMEIVGNTFINCSNPSEDYSIVLLSNGNYIFENNTFINSTNSVGNIYLDSAFINILKFDMDYRIINVSNKEVNQGLKIDNFNITDDKGNIVQIPSVNVNLENDKASYSFPSSMSKDGISVTFSDVPENGIYNLTLSYGDSTSDVLSAVNVSLSNDPVEFWVSPEGFDGNNGTQEYPFATIQHALDVGFGKSFDVTINLLKGNYTNEGNIALTIANKGNLKIIGVYNETIFDANDNNWFFDVSTTNVVLTNLKFINGCSRKNYLVSGGNRLTLEKCIFENNHPNYQYYDIIKDPFKLDGIVFVNNSYGRIAGSNFEIADSIFADNECVYIDINDGKIENCKFINNWANDRRVITGKFTSINNYYANSSMGSVVLATGDSDFINDTFENNYNDWGNGAAISISYNQRDASSTPLLSFENCRFINNTAWSGGAVSLKIGRFNNCSFINNTAFAYYEPWDDYAYYGGGYGGAFYLMPYIKVDESSAEGTINSLELINVTFEGNTAEFNGNDVYLERPSDWPTNIADSNFAYGIPLTITFNDKNVTLLVDDLTATVQGPCGAVVGAKYLTFELNGTQIGAPEVINGVATFNYPGFEEGNFILTGNNEYPNGKNVINAANISVKFENILDHADVWVSVDGSDENGNGSQSNPFKSISHAIKESIKNCRDITVYMNEGIFNGDLNTKLSLSSINNITIIGKGIDKTVIDGEGINYFAKVTEGDNKVIISNLTIKNMTSSADNKVGPIDLDLNSTLYLDTVSITGFATGMANEGNLFIDNSVLSKNLGLYYSSGFGYLTINNTLISSSLGSFNGGESISINNSVINDIITTSGGFELIYSWNATIENTVISNDANNTSLEVWGIGEADSSLNPALLLTSDITYLNNVSITNNWGNPIEEYNSGYGAGNYLSVFGHAYWVVGRDVTAYNSTFSNFKYLWSINTYAPAYFLFDGCVFNNITVIGLAQTFENGYCVINNSVFVNSDPVIDRFNRGDRADPNCTFDNNYWGSNDKPVVTYINPGRADSFEPATWIALYSEDEQTVIKNVTDGVNSTAYLGNAPIRTDYADNKGALDYAVVFGPVGYLFTTDDETNVIFNASEPIFPFEAADPMDYRTPTVIVITGYEGDINIVGMLVDIVGNPIANATITSTFADLAPVNTTTDANGTFKVKAGKNGVLKVVFAGDETYFDTEGNLTFANAGKTAKTFINFNEVEGDFAITGVLVDDEGTPIANAAIKAIINSNTTVNTTTDDKGAFKVQGLSNCVINVIFAGDDVYNPSNATITLNNLAPKRAATVIEGNNYTQNAIEYKLGERGGNFTVQLKDASGKALANKTVLIGYNGKCLERTTDENGYANVQINLASENRLTFAVAFLGDDEYNATMSVYLITITKKPVTISAPDKTFKASAKTKSYTVTLSTVKGVDGKTYFGAGKKVTLKVDGKTYTAKTNDKGQATFKLNMAKKGTFKATVSYAGDGTYQAATKTSKIKIN